MKNLDLKFSEICQPYEAYLSGKFNDSSCDLENTISLSKIQSKDAITTIVICNIRTKEDLENLLIMENKLILLKFQKYGELDNPYRENLASVITYNLVKKNYKER